MTPVIIATAQDGFARLWYRDADGGLHQTANVLVGSADPAELAAIASDMHERFAWGKLIKARNGDEPPKETKEQLTKRQIARRASTDRLKRTKAEIEAFDTLVHEDIYNNPSTTIPEITRRVLDGAHDKNNQSNVRASITRLLGAGAIVKEFVVEQGQPHRYSAVLTTNESLGESGGHGGPNEQPDESP